MSHYFYGNRNKITYYNDISNVTKDNILAQHDKHDINYILTFNRTLLFAITNSVLHKSYEYH